MSTRKDKDLASVVNALGRTVFVDAGDRRGQRLLESEGDANPHSMTMWRDLLNSRPWDLVVDVGANYGEMLLGVHLPRDAAVVAFEPNERVLPFLRRSVSRAALDVDIRPMAASDRRGRDLLIQDRDWSGMSRLNIVDPLDDAHQVSEQECEVTTLTAELSGSTYRRACIKIDIEGHEGPCLRGAAAWLDQLDEYALLVEVMHMTPQEIGAMSSRWCMYLRHLRTGRLVRIAEKDEQGIERLLNSGAFYRQDAVFSSVPLSSLSDGHAEEFSTLLELLTALDEEIDEARTAVGRANGQLHALQSSRSWRLTAPFRKIKRVRR